VNALHACFSGLNFSITLSAKLINIFVKTSLLFSGNNKTTARVMDSINEQNKEYRRINEFNEGKEERIIAIQLREDRLQRQSLKSIEKCLTHRGSQRELAKLRENIANRKMKRQQDDAEIEAMYQDDFDHPGLNWWDLVAEYAPSTCK
jgi:hypothetical protein